MTGQEQTLPTPAEVMAAHPSVGIWCRGCAPQQITWPCLPYLQAQRITELEAEVAALRKLIRSEPADLRIVGTWLVEEVGRHTCGTGADGHYGAHEPGCGQEPIVNLATVPGFAALAGEGAAEHVHTVRAGYAVCTVCGEGAAEAECVCDRGPRAQDFSSARRVYPRDMCPVHRGGAADQPQVADEDREPCDAERHSWDYFTPGQVDSYWMRCCLLAPHDGKHENSETGAKW